MIFSTQTNRGFYGVKYLLLILTLLYVTALNLKDALTSVSQAASFYTHYYKSLFVSLLVFICFYLPNTKWNAPTKCDFVSLHFVVVIRKMFIVFHATCLPASFWSDACRLSFTLTYRRTILSPPPYRIGEYFTYENVIQFTLVIFSFQFFFVFVFRFDFFFVFLHLMPSKFKT